MNTDEHLRRAQWQGAQMLAEHQLLQEDYWDGGRGGRWLIGQQDTVQARCEIFAGIFGSLVVHGDFDTARFAQYDHSDAWSRLRWMADCTDVGYYVFQKARIGMGAAHMGDCYNPEVAENDLAWLEHQTRTEVGDDHELVTLLEEARLEHAENEQDLWQFLHAGDKGWDLFEYRIGKIVPSHVVVAHVALNKCVWLLRERHGDRGPKECR